MKLLEHQVKDFLRGQGLPVPAAGVAHTPDDAVALAISLGHKVVVKALVPAGRRGKAGGVRMCADPISVREAAVQILGSEMAGYVVDAVYVESAVESMRELYLSFIFGPLAPQMIISCEGGVDVEQMAADRPASFVRLDIDPLKKLMPWQAAAAWEKAGAPSEELPRLAAVSTALYAAFVAADGAMLEINPLSLTSNGEVSIIGAMLEIDDNALHRHQAWEAIAWSEKAVGTSVLNERELAVMLASKNLPGGAVRYTELDGDIGLFVAGGGAGLLQHDMLIAAGGTASCHTDLSATPTPEKPAALIEAILRNPDVKGLLIGFNYLQLAPCDCIARALLIALERCAIDTSAFPVVVRLFGPAEDEARQLLAGRPGIDYLPSGAPLEDGVKRIVAAVAAKKMASASREAE